MQQNFNIGNRKLYGNIYINNKEFAADKLEKSLELSGLSQLTNDTEFCTSGYANDLNTETTISGKNYTIQKVKNVVSDNQYDSYSQKIKDLEESLKIEYYNPSATLNIETLADLQQFALSATAGYQPYLTGTINLCNDIDCSVWTDFNGICTYGSAASSLFRGTFNGNEKTIKNLNINVTKHGGGFFNATSRMSSEKPCQINDLNFDNINFIHNNGIYSRIGTIIGQACLPSKITNCHITNTKITGKYQKGGLIGSGYGRIYNSSFEGTINSEYLWGDGGLIGNSQGTLNIENCSVDVVMTFSNISQGDLTDPVVGGLVGTSNGEDRTSYMNPITNNTINSIITINNVSCFNTPIIGALGQNFGEGGLQFIPSACQFKNNYWTKETCPSSQCVLYWEDENSVYHGPITDKDGNVFYIQNKD